jgi:Mg-chelatase subunit ChlI
MKAAIYARVSTFDQEPENQLQELRRYVEALLRALALRSGDVMYSDIADHASAPVSSRIHMRFSAVVSVRVTAKCHNTASGAANASATDVSKSAVLGVSKPRMQVNRRPTRPSRLSDTDMAVTQRGTMGGCGRAEFI